MFCDVFVREIKIPGLFRPFRDVGSPNKKIVSRARLGYSAIFCSVRINYNDSLATILVNIATEGNRGHPSTTRAKACAVRATCCRCLRTGVEALYIKS